MRPLQLLTLAGGSGRVRPPHPPLLRRDPLPPFPPGHYDRTLPFIPPHGPDVLFPRGNFCGVRVPDVPILPGMAGYTLSPQPTAPLVMALDIFKYTDRDQQNEILITHGTYGYTHYQVSIGHALEEGWTMDMVADLCNRIQGYCGFVDAWFLGGGPWASAEGKDRDAAYWAPLVDPWIDMLVSGKLIDCACVGWQLDGYNVPGDPILSIIDHFAEKLCPHEIPLGTHWINEAGGWWQTGGSPQNPGVTDRFSWWRRMRNRLTWFNHQGPTHYNGIPFNEIPDYMIPDYQAHMVDTLQPFGDGRMGTSGLFGDRPFSLIVYEDSGQAQFNDPLGCTEDDGDLRGYLLCCTKGASLVGGYGNGARLPDGEPL